MAYLRSPTGRTLDSRREEVAITEQERCERVGMPMYEAGLAPFLPPVVLGCHTHAWTRDFQAVTP
ncbi:MAG TPA: hypothetical protein VLH79_08580 [Chthonomonadales bacterium]|nr:hypothetical protein [Chthonomonadales bacterium]